MRLLLCGLLLSAPAAAEARMHAPYKAHRIVPGVVLESVVSASTAAFSFRKLRSAYAGSAVKLRRVDTTTLDIGFVGNNFDIAAATAFCTTACTVQTVFDQSGNSRDLVQATAANQPLYQPNCIGGNPCMRMTAGSHFMQAASYTTATGIMSFSVVGNRSVGIGSCQWFRTGGAGTNRLQAAGGANTWQVGGGVSGNAGFAASDTAWHAAQGVLNGTSTILSIDGAEATGTATGNAIAGTPTIGGANTTTCDQTEALFWDNYARSATELAALQRNQKGYWGTP